MKMLITGGTVFVSRFTAEYFARRGHKVYAINRGSRPQPEGGHADKKRQAFAEKLLKGHAF